VVSEIRGAGGVGEFVACDISSESGVESLIAQSVSFLSGLDFAVNNAGIADHPGFPHDLPVDAWDTVMSIDLRGTFLCMWAELRVMHAAGHGAIVNMASNAGREERAVDGRVHLGQARRRRAHQATDTLHSAPGYIRDLLVCSRCF
jgi:NAD(P)-dependent dehydrogenase (short-subunit alcohol dehydrogenase family)